MIGLRKHVGGSVLCRAGGCLLAYAALGAAVGAVEPMQVGFMWHMHQPIYYPGETITQTQAAGHYSFSLYDVHNQRFGPYTTWPRDAMQTGQGLPHLGAQVSFSGSLMDNLNRLEAAGVNGGMWNNWDAAYRQAAQMDTSLGNPRLDMVGFGYHHPLMPLLDERDMRMQIKLHKYAHEQTWGPNVPYSKGIFPAETAFAERMIPALVAEGLEWAIVDNIHFDRATQGYPHTNASNLFPPNRADQVNPDPAASGGAWVQLNNLWAPSRVSAPFSYQPHQVQYVNPATGQTTKMVAVPGARYEGNEDGRGGFGALQYEQVMEQYRQYNTDPAHPLFVLLHHDGDNFGGGSESYYHGNWQNMVNWAAANPNYDVSTVQDYLDRFPVAANDVIHVESGSWAGADNGDPEFKKWLGDPDASGFSYDRNSWAVLTAAKNRVFTADDLAPALSMGNIAAGAGTATERAWHYLLQAEASDHWYWDGTQVWDSNVTRGSNLAVAQANQVINALGAAESTPPTVFVPQRESYNPGGLEWGTAPEPSDFEVWTYAYDVSGLSSVTLKYRTDGDGVNPLASTQNETYAGGAEVGAWASVTMTASDIAPPANVLAPTYRASRFGGMIAGLEDVLVDYYVEAVDSRGNVSRTDIQHVYVGAAASPPGGDAVEISPDPVLAGEPVTLSYNPAGGPLAAASQVFLHYGFDDWSTVAADVPMTWNAAASRWNATVPVASTATQFDAVFNNGAGVWDNNSGQDWHFDVDGATGPEFVMDGQLDAAALPIAVNGTRRLYAALQGTTLYLATEDAGEGSDLFIYLADAPGAMRAANWAKTGQVADWDAFLADENNNDYESWFDAVGATQAATGANGGVLEGVIDLAAEFGALPAVVYLAVGAFATNDGGALAPLLQIPASLDGDGNIEANEFVRLLLAHQPADFNGDGAVDGDDLAEWRLAFGPAGGADADDDGDSDGADFLAWQRALAVAPSATQTAVPEPSTAALAALAVAACLLRRWARILVSTAALALCAAPALAQAPPNPNFTRQQVFPSYQEFKNRLTAISSVADAAQRTAQLDALWTQLRNAGQVPYAQGSQMAFLYRGAATSVAWAGDFNGWNPSSSAWRGTQLAGTDLWMLEKTFAPDARLDYKIVTGGSNWILDPANSLQMWSGFGPNSELRMPDFQFPMETVRQASVARGTLGANVTIASAQLGYNVNYRVYTPAGYTAASSRNLPVVYVTDGHEYSAEHMGSTTIVLDNLIASGGLQPTVAVFIDPRDPTTGANRRASEYVQNPKFLGFVADELVPAVDGAYRTLASPGGRAILGTSLGGLNSAYFGANRPEVFGNIAVQSPASFYSFTPQLLNQYATQPLQDKLDVFVTAGTIGDGNGGTSFAAVLAQHDYDYTFVQRNEGHSWGQWRGLIDDMLVELLGPTPALAADFNEDGAVDAADQELWKVGQGKAAGAVHLDGDADGDRDVDGDDLLLWQRQLGEPSPPPASTAVPEPTSAAIAGCCLLGAAKHVACRRSTRCRHACRCSPCR